MSANKKEDNREEGDQREGLLYELREKAEEIIQSGKNQDVPYSNIEDLVYELRVYQIELETQNEALRKTQDDLFTSNAMYQSLFDSAPVGYFVLNMNTTILNVNLAGLDMLDRQKSLLIGSRFSSRVHGEDQPLLREHLKELTTTEDPRGCEIRMRRKGGDYFWARLSCVIINNGGSGDSEEQVLATMYDISEKMEYEKRLMETMNEYTSIVETANSIIAKIDLKGRLTFINRYGLELLGYKEKELLGKNIVGTIVPKETGRKRDLSIVIEEMLRNPADFDKETELENMRSDGTRIWVLWKNQEIRNNAGEITGILGIGQDITERKEAEDIIKRDKETLQVLIKERTKELEEARAEADRARRLQDLGRISASIAHELRNPLASIKLSLQNIRRKRKNPDIDTHLAHCEEKIYESDYIINNLLKSSSLQKPELEDTDLASLILKCVNEVTPHYSDKNVTVYTEMEAIQGVSIKSDKIQIMEVITNILKNAFDAVPKEEGKITIQGFFNEESVGFTIQDNDHGVPPEEISKLTDPFYTNKSRGVGLGLSISKEILALHKGTLDITSSVGKGTTITVTLPREE